MRAWADGPGYGIRQLVAIFEEDAQRWLIMTANIKESIQSLAEKDGVQIMDGIDFVDWRFEHCQNLSVVTRSRLGLSDIPVLIYQCFELFDGK